MSNYSIIIPMDTDRFKQFTVTKRIYDSFPQTKEIIIPTRNEKTVGLYLADHKLMKDVRLIPYTLEMGFNVSKALNIGVANARYEDIIITSPEVKPPDNLLEELDKSDDNTIFQVWDESEDGSLSSLVHKGYRDMTPAMYFLARFKKSDILKINGWDEKFLEGYAYEDDDFGERWVRARLEWVTRDDITGFHQYHPRAETIPSGTNINFAHLQENNNKQVIRPEKGIEKYL